MKRVITYLLSIVLLTFGFAHAATVTSVTITDAGGSGCINYPLTLGIVLKQGDATGSLYLSTLSTQTDVLSTWPDGSIKHAMVSAIIPSITSGGSVTLAVNTTGTAASSTPVSKAEFLATDLEAAISLTSMSGSDYTGSRATSLRDVITAGTIGTTVTPNNDLDYWLSGSVCTEIVAREPILDDSSRAQMNALYEVRYWPGSGYGMCVRVGIENVEASYRGDVVYTASVSLGEASPSTQLWDSGSTTKTVTHISQSRWIKEFWIGTKPPAINIAYDVDYLISTGMFMGYDTSLNISEATIASRYAGWSAADTDIFGENYSGGSYYAGLAFKYFPNTGGRPDIGVLPRWAVEYLLTGDNRLLEMNQGQADLFSNAYTHWRESDPAMAFYGYPVSVSDRPNVMTLFTYDASTGLPADIGTQTANNWSVDRAHQPSIAYIPYIFTGHRYYLDEMYYWAGWDISEADPDSSWGRVGASGLIRDQVRGEAWTLRNISHAAAIAPAEIYKTYLSNIIANNITSWDSEENRYPLNYWGIDSYASPTGMTSDVKYVGSPWMEDYMLLSIINSTRLGFAFADILSWYKTFNNGRFLGTGVNPYDGASYRFPAQFTDNSYPDTWAEFAAAYAVPATSWTAPTAASHDYKLIALAASRASGNESAIWIESALTTAGFDFTLFETDPTWAILYGELEAPTYDPPTITGPHDFSTTASSVEIEGPYTVDPDLPDQSVTVTWTLGESSGFCVAALGVFSCTVPVELGANSIVFAVTDSNSGTANDTTVVTRTAVPQASITNTSISHGVLRH